MKAEVVSGCVAPLLLLLAGCQATVSGQARATVDGSTQGKDGVRVIVGVQGGVVGKGGLIRFKDGKLDYSGTINFAYNNDRLETDETFQVLGGLRDFLRKTPGVKVQIEGHTDSRGSTAYNKELSTRRAASIRRWLVDHGVEEKRMTSVGFGKEKAAQNEPRGCLDQLPKDTSPCEDGWAISRRAVFTVTEGAETLRTTTSPGAGSDQGDAPPSLVRRWLLGGHLGYLVPAHDGPPLDAYRGVVPLGLDVGLWLSERWALGLTVEPALGVESGSRFRGELWTEAHSSAGPGPELWLGLGLGAERIAPGSASAELALRLGVDFHASPRVRVGPFLEAALGQYAEESQVHGWLGPGLRLAVDFFVPR